MLQVKKCIMEFFQISELYTFIKTYQLLHMHFPKPGKCNIAFDAQ